MYNDIITSWEVTNFLDLFSLVQFAGILVELRRLVAADLITDVVVFLLMLTMVGDCVLILSSKSTMTVWYESVLLT